MPIKIHLKGNEEEPEYQGALQLKHTFEKGISDPNIDGEILIISSATLFGQEVKDIDLVILGNFKNFKETLNSKATTANSYQDIDPDQLSLRNRSIYFNNFCFTIELKEHSADKIKLDGTHLCVKYKNKWSDVTTQSEKQKYSLKGFFEERMNKAPYICNFIWFRNISWDQLRELVQANGNTTSHNYLPSEFSYRFILQLACVQNLPYIKYNTNNSRFNNNASFSSFYQQEFDFYEVQKAFDFFSAEKEIVGIITRKKIETITTRLLKDQKYARAIGKMLLVIAGRAGTGKTIKLLNIAFDLCSRWGERCLILTYNHALVSDIKRILAITDIPDGVDKGTIQITTLHRFFFELLVGFDIAKGKFKSDFLEKYDDYLNELIEYIRKGLIEESDIQELMQSRHEQVAWDFIFIDESQDWHEKEKEVLFTIFGKERIIIADGVDQMVRSNARCEWTRGLGRLKNTTLVEEKQPHKYWKQIEKRSLRQKTGLVDFINAYAEASGVNWSIERFEELPGGSVIVTTKEYDKAFHKAQSMYLMNNDNTPYEMLFLVPPTLVKSNYNSEKKKKYREFKLLNDFENMGIELWDGTNRDLRVAYSTNLNEYRLLQYDSCRGLEGWTVVCMHFDDFLQYKYETYEEIEGQISLLNEMNSFEERRKEFVALWALMPLTRAVDRLVITIKDKSSEVYKILKTVYLKRPDLIEWIE